jgi:hypothetical protein
MKVIGTEADRYLRWVGRSRGGSYNGAYYYAVEIEDIILPALDLGRGTIITAGANLQMPRRVHEGTVVVCHNNQDPEVQYKLLLGKDILWICSKPSTVDKLAKVGENSVYIPLSIDTRYVEKFKTKKTKDTAFVGNRWSFKYDYLHSLPPEIDQLSNLPRETLLAEMAKYRKVIAEGRCLMEAQVLGCEVEIPDYKDPSIGAIFREVFDTIDAIPLWAETLAVFSKKS